MNPTAKCPPADNARRTPSDIVERAREVLGTIDLDPASDLQANETVGAKTIFTKEDDGLLKEWHGNVFLNPPGGKIRLEGDTRDSSKSALWWAKLLYEIAIGHTTQAIFVCFNLEAMLNTQKFAPLPIQAFPFCVPRTRLKYPSSAGGKTNGPPGASAIVYLGGSPYLFQDCFSALGYVTEVKNLAMARPRLREFYRCTNQ